MKKEESSSDKAAELRRCVEAQLRSKDTKESLPRSGADLRRHLHELQVHQVELEMQNEELRRVRNELQVTQNKYAELYDLAPVGYFTLDVRGRIQEVNIVGAQLLGVERRQLVNKPLNRFIADAAGKESFSRHIESVLQRQGMQRCELRFVGKDGTVTHGQLQSVAVGETEDKEVSILTSIIDSTRHNQMESALRDAHDKLELTVLQRTKELTRAKALLLREIDMRKGTEESLRGALAQIKELKDRLQAENVYLRQQVSGEHNFSEIIGQSDAIAYVFFRIEQVAPQDATVLLLGETGTGKGVVARAIHGRSSRRDRPMITVNCTALPANLIESELFGREKGAFTGANVRQIGRFELAHGGTILLDEIGEMPLELQCKLLRVIQDGEFERLGSPHTIKVNVRIIATTNRNLEEEIRNGRFRQDLFYRLNVFPITIPPLRQRKEDIPLLVHYFVAKFNKKMGKKIEAVSKETLCALQQYSWPGNVRELESVIERSVITSQGPLLQVLDRFDTFLKTGDLPEQDMKALAELERDHIVRVLQKTGWRIEGENGAAVLLGLNPSTLRARMRKYDIHRP
ncbi:MAG: sigma-54 interaction domain-containing protein [Pedobacter sp.]